MFFQPSNRRSRRTQLQISERRLLLMIGDIVAVALAVLISLRIWAFVAARDFTLEFILPQSYFFLVMMGVWLLLASANDLYDLPTAASRTQTFQRLLIVNIQLVVFYVVIFFLAPPMALPRLFILYYAVSSFLLIGAWRFSRPVLLGWASEARRILIIGANGATETIVEAIKEQANSDYEVKGIIGAPEDIGKMICGVPVVGTGADLMNFVIRDRISELVTTSTKGLSGELFQGVMDAYERGITIMPMTLLYEHVTGRVPVEHIHEDWAFILQTAQNSSGTFQINQFFKRSLDIILSLIGLVLFILMLPFLALAIRLDSPGSIFYSQERVGLNGRIFRIYKLRSMVTNAEQATGAVFSRRGDPRITRVGGIMRKTRLDELPQFLNVLRGDMSLVGPRPERPEHVVRLTEKIPFYRTRLIVRPGVSGWAQVQYDYGSTDEDALVKLQYDLYYIRHQSVFLDLNIMVRTVGKALMFKGV